MRAPKKIFLAVLAVALSGSGLVLAQVPTPDAKLCKILPVAEIEAALGGKIVRKLGSDTENYSTCTGNPGGDVTAKVEYHTPGQAGLPSDVKTGLMGVTAMLSSQIKQSRDFGDMGCYQTALKIAGQEAKSTACFKPKGYYTLTLGKLSGDFVPMETVKTLLEKIAATPR